MLGCDVKHYTTLSLVIGMISLRCFASGNSQFTPQISQYGDEWPGTVFGSVEIEDVAENLSMDFELVDTSGYLAVGASYGWYSGQILCIIGNYVWPAEYAAGAAGGVVPGVHRGGRTPVS